MSWDAFFMGLARYVASKSKDATKVGAVAAGPHHHVLEVGYNGPPRGVLDLPERFERPDKYNFVTHAEQNAVASAARARLEGSTFYVTHLCCSGCARALIQAGVAKIVYGNGTTSMPPEEFEAAIIMLAEAGVELIHYDDTDRV